MNPIIRRLALGLSLAIGLIAAGAIGYAQGQGKMKPVFPQTRDTVPLEAPTILSGPDVGFRIDGWRGRAPVGKLIVKVDGKWVEVEFGGGVKLMTSQ